MSLGIIFAKGDLIVDRKSKEVGILVKKSRIVHTELILNTSDTLIEGVSNWGWEILWIKKDIPQTEEISPFQSVDRVLTEEGMRMSIFAGYLEHFPAGKDNEFDINAYL